MGSRLRHSKRSDLAQRVRIARPAAPPMPTHAHRGVGRSVAITCHTAQDFRSHTFLHLTWCPRTGHGDPELGRRTIGVYAWTSHHRTRCCACVRAAPPPRPPSGGHGASSGGREARRARRERRTPRRELRASARGGGGSAGPQAPALVLRCCGARCLGPAGARLSSGV